jgi:hypothetical protein
MKRTTNQDDQNSLSELAELPLTARAREALAALEGYAAELRAPLGEASQPPEAIAGAMDVRRGQAIGHLKAFLAGSLTCLADPEWTQTVADPHSVGVELGRAGRSLAAATHHAHRSGREALDRVVALLARMPDPQRASTRRMLLDAAIQTCERLSRSAADEADTVAERFRWLARTARVPGYDTRANAPAEPVLDIDALLADSEGGGASS